MPGQVAPARPSQLSVGTRFPWSGTLRRQIRLGVLLAIGWGYSSQLRLVFGRYHLRLTLLKCFKLMPEWLLGKLELMYLSLRIRPILRRLDTLIFLTISIFGFVVR